MKHLFIISMLWILKYHATAQVFNSEYPYTITMDSILQNVNKTFMTNTILYDRILPVAGLHYFNTVLFNTSSRAHWEQAQFELYHSAYIKTGMTYPADLSLKMDVRIQEGKVPVRLLNYRFNWLNTTSVRGLLQSTNDRFDIIYH